MRFHLVAPLALLIALANPVGAEHCTTWTSSTTTDRMLVIEGPYLLFDYFVTDLCQVPPGDPTTWPSPGLYGRYVPFPGWDHNGDGSADGCLFSIWLYYESNGIPGLQRGDWVVDDSCHGMIESDSFVW